MNLKSILTPMKCYFSIFVLTVIASFSASAQSMQSFMVENVSAFNATSSQSYHINQIILIEGNALFVNAIANLNTGAATNYHWRVQADMNNNGTFGEDEIIYSTMTSTNKLRNNISLSAELMSLLTTSDQVSFKVIVGSDNDFPEEGNGPQEDEAEVNFDGEGPIKVGSTAEASGHFGCLSRDANRIVKRFTITNKSKGSINFEDLDIDVTALHYQGLGEVFLPLTLQRNQSVDLDLVFKKTFDEFRFSKVNATVSVTWINPNGEVIVGTKEKTFNICSQNLSGWGKNVHTFSTATPLISASPNPFDQVANIDYRVNKESMTNIVIYNAIGQKVKTLVANTLKEAGTYQVEWRDENINPGMYFVQITVGGERKTIQLLKQK